VLLEGPAIEPLLAQVRQEYGPSARIISADKVRTGGLGGFFTRQRYELSVEVDDEIAARAAAPSAASAADDVPAAIDGTGDGADPGTGPLDGILALVEASEERPATPARREAGTETLRANLVSTANPGFAEVLAGLQAATAGSATAESAIDGPALGAPGAGATPTAAARRTASVVHAYRPSVVTADEPGTRDPGPRAADLVRLGVPRELADRGTDADPYRAAIEALADLPAPPVAPDRPGDVLVIAGELTQALLVARQVAADLRLDPSSILLAGPSAAGTGIHPAKRISGPAEAEKRARRLHRADVPHVVVLDVPMTADDGGWARDVCDAIGATAVWAVVDATRKTADTARHLRTIGDIDAVAVHGSRATADPATPLALAEPIALLDGRPATPHAWAALLAERLQPPPPAARGRRRRAANRDTNRETLANREGAA
jgi:hypothetical protein